MNTKRNVWLIGITALVLTLSACGNPNTPVAENAPTTEDNPIPEDSAEVQAQNLGWVRCHQFRWGWCLGLKYGDGFGEATNSVEFSKVFSLQASLVIRGFNPGPVDGLFGRRTLEAVKAAQRAYGLPVTGLVKTCTWTALAHGYNWIGSKCRG